MARKRDTISERHGLCTVCNRYGRLHPAKIPPQGAGFRGFHRMYQLQTPTAPMERTDSIHRLHYPRNGSLPLFLPVRWQERNTVSIEKDNFDKPICMDQSDRLNELNHFPADGRFQTFLLDKDNKVVVIGNPIHNPNIRELYLKEITGKQPVSHTRRGYNLRLCPPIFRQTSRQAGRDPSSKSHHDTERQRSLWRDDFREMQYESTDKIKHSGDGSINKREGRACRIYWNDHKQASHPTFTHEAERRWHKSSKLNWKRNSRISLSCRRIVSKRLNSQKHKL